uniref:Uncharacterized protein n=1 Tax=Siphoviridae sp. ctE6L85 TaxID=2826202 RepID=A0A8S5QPX4_9CAUD|nr:MAG TPA: hypothetical protein [Siphoviridae sp. ctE6L85]
MKSPTRVAGPSSVPVSRLHAPCRLQMKKGIGFHDICNR